MARQPKHMTRRVNAWVKVGQPPVRPGLLLLHELAVANTRHEASFHYPLPAPMGRSGMGFLSPHPIYISIPPPITPPHFLFHLLSDLTVMASRFLSLASLPSRPRTGRSTVRTAHPTARTAPRRMEGQDQSIISIRTTSPPRWPPLSGRRRR